MKKADLKKYIKLRKLFLRQLYVETEGKETAIKNAIEIGYKLGFTEDDADKISKDLVQSRKAVFRAHQGVAISITQFGAREAEDEILKPSLWEKLIYGIGAAIWKFIKLVFKFE